MQETFKGKLQKDKDEFTKNFESRLSKDGGDHSLGKSTVKKYADGSNYKGQMLNSNRHGLGVYYYTNGDIYAGDWRNNVFEGRGRYIFAGGEYFEGTLVNGKKHGQGVYVYTNGNTYEGSWAFDKKHGFGKYQYFGTAGKVYFYFRML